MDVLGVAGVHVLQHGDQAAGGDVGSELEMAEAGQAAAGQSEMAGGLAIAGQQGGIDRVDDIARPLWALLAERPDRPRLGR